MGGEKGIHRRIRQIAADVPESLGCKPIGQKKGAEQQRLAGQRSLPAAVCRSQVTLRYVLVMGLSFQRLLEPPASGPAVRERPSVVSGANLTTARRGAIRAFPPMSTGGRQHRGR